MNYKGKEIKDLEYSVSKLTSSAIKFNYCSIDTDDIEINIEPEQLLKELSQLVNQAIASGTLKPGLSRFGAKIDDDNDELTPFLTTYFPETDEQRDARIKKEKQKIDRLNEADEYVKWLNIEEAIKLLESNGYRVENKNQTEE
jgi:hypothetical protein